jgi:hypothetical protein
VTNVKEVAEELESAYLHLDDNWRGVQGREKFLQMMILEGRRLSDHLVPSFLCRCAATSEMR